MTNSEIAKILREMGMLYEMDDVQFKPRAYEKAAMAIEELSEGVRELYKRGGKKALDGIPGVGPAIAAHIEALLNTGTFSEYRRLKKKIPVALDELVAVEGLGPKMVKALYQKLRVRSLKDLEHAAKAGKIRKLPHFGAKSEEKILRGIEFLRKSKGRFLLGTILPLIRTIEERLRKVPGVEQVTTAGSVRRFQETIGDIDILVTAKKPDAVMKVFTGMPEVEAVIARGPTKSAVRLRQGVNADVRVLPDESYGAALQYFTGDKAHNIEVRKIAIKKGWKLNEYGLFKGTKRIAGHTEEEIYKKLGLAWIPPDIRTASGEIEAAAKGKLPDLIPFGSIRGDCQVQTEWTDGSASIAQMVEAAQKAGLEYIVITDHTRSLAMTGGLDERKLAQQGKEIDRLNRKFQVLSSKFQVLKGAEVNILKDGTPDIADEALRKLDIVCISVHSHFGMTEREMTERIIRALKHPHVNILLHPTGRIIGRREPYKVDMEKVIRAAKQYGVALEANSSPERLDLKDAHIRMAIEVGAKLVVDSDAHSPSHFGFLDFGVAQARRGWGTAKDVLNTLSVENFLKALKGLKKR